MDQQQPGQHSLRATVGEACILRGLLPRLPQAPVVGWEDKPGWERLLNIKKECQERAPCL